MRRFVLLTAAAVVLSGSPQEYLIANAREGRFYAGGAGAVQTDAEHEEPRDGLAQKMDSPEAGYDQLKRRLLEGHFEEVQAALDVRDPNGSYALAGYRFAALRATCASAIFLLYSRQASPLGWPTEEEGAELRRLARNATTAYEEVFRLARSDFERACVYARWHELHNVRRFEADSRLLRGGSPLERPDDPADETLASQRSRLRATASPVLGSLTPLGKPMSQEMQNLFLDVFGEEYRKLARMGVPEDAFVELLEDVPAFLQKAIHPAVLADTEKHRLTLEYHLWYALTGPRPDAIDNEFIDRYVKLVDGYLREGFARGMPEYAETASKTFLELVELERGNRFIPRLKQPLWPYEWSQPRNRYEKSIEGRIRESIDNAMRRPNLPMPRFFTAEQIQERMDQQAATRIRSVTVSVMSALNNYQSFAYGQQPPGMRFAGGGGGTTHEDSSIWVYTLDKSEPVPPYPWKKEITPLDASTGGTRRIALRVLTAFREKDVATLDTVILESRAFTKQDVHELAGVFAASTPSVDDANNILIAEPWSWSAVRVRSSGGEEPNAPILVFLWKDGEWWLAWAGVIEKGDQRSLAAVLTQLKPGLEQPRVPEPVKMVPPASVAFLDDVTQMTSLPWLDAGHGWRVQLALAEQECLSPLKLLCCRAEWTDANRPPKAIPFGRYAGRHLGPVVWTVREDGFREDALDLYNCQTPPMTLHGDGRLHMAVLPFDGSKQACVQVYSAFDGRELARQQISLAETSVWPWGYFMAHGEGEPFGIAADFQAGAPVIPAFKPVPWLAGESVQGKDASIDLSLKDGFFTLKADKRILPARGGRLLARWWLNDRPVIPQAVGEATSLVDAYAEGPASFFRVPAGVPFASLNAKPGERVGLQLMLCPGGIESASSRDSVMPSPVGPDFDEAPTVPLLTNRIDFRVEAAMLARRSPKAPTAATFHDLTDAITRQNVADVRRLVAAYPQLVSGGAQAIQGPAVTRSQKLRGGVTGGGGSGESPLELVCRHRPTPRYIFWKWKVGGHVTREYWKQMAEIAGVLIDYGADVDARTPRQMNETPLQTLIRSQFLFGRAKEQAPPIELLEALLDRGANVNVGGARGTLLSYLIEEIQTNKCNEMIPAVECLLRHGADVFAVEEPWQRETVFEQVDSLNKQGYAELAALIAKYGQERLTSSERAVRLGVEELLAGLRNADAKALSALNDELPWGMGLDWLRFGRTLQEQFGPALDGLGRIDQVRIRGDWAEALLPTGQPGDRAYLYVVLVRFPGGAYHAVQAGFTETRAAGTRLRHADMTYADLMNAVYWALGRSDRLEGRGERRGEYPRHEGLLSIASERGRLVVRALEPDWWRYFRAELTPEMIWLWGRGWDLNLLRTMTDETGDRRLILADGAVTVQHGDRTLVFRRHDDKVQLQEDDQERLAPSFTLDVQTLAVGANHHSPLP